MRLSVASFATRAELEDAVAAERPVGADKQPNKKTGKKGKKKKRTTKKDDQESDDQEDGAWRPGKSLRAWGHGRV